MERSPDLRSYRKKIKTRRQPKGDNLFRLRTSGKKKKKRRGCASQRGRRTDFSGPAKKGKKFFPFEREKGGRDERGGEKITRTGSSCLKKKRRRGLHSYLRREGGKKKGMAYLLSLTTEEVGRSELCPRKTSLRVRMVIAKRETEGEEKNVRPFLSSLRKEGEGIGAKVIPLRNEGDSTRTPASA